MVDVRVVRQGVEVLFTPPPVVALSRISIEALAAEDGTGTVDIVRQGIEVLADPGAIVTLNRIDLEVIASEDGTSNVDVVRQGIEVLYEPPPTVALSRISMEAAAADDGTGNVDVVRQAIEILFRRSILPGTPLDLPAGFEAFLHNWVEAFEIENAYLTDVTTSRTTGARERRGLRQKPIRTLSCAFLNESREEIDRLLVLMRRLTDTRFPFPIFCDEAPLTGSSSGSIDNFVLCDTSNRRFFPNARVLIAQQGDFAVGADDIQTAIIQEVQSDRLIFTTTLTANVDATYSVFPLVDCELLLEPHYIAHTDSTYEVKLDMVEVHGANTLPPVTSDIPPGFAQYDGYPILNFGNDFASGIEVAFRRSGTISTQGRAFAAYPTDPRYRQVIKWRLLGEDRDASWSVLEFFDSRRGRQRAFWVMDEEDIWTPVDVSGVFLSIDPLGDFDDFSENFDAVAVLMTDGTIHVRRVITIQAVLGVWRVTLDNDLDIDVADIRRVARARLHTFSSDALTETWQTTEVAQFEFETEETLNEGEETL